ncbi:MAG TPA: hypothetical protein GXX38_08905 [Clostridia bacterium]|nr:hypothetical protein [Clostridia bacterium]
MIKTRRKGITILLIISMLVQLFVGAAPVLTEDSNNLRAEHGFVPLLKVTLSPGETVDTISATIHSSVYGSLLVNVTEEKTARPHVREV